MKEKIIKIKEELKIIQELRNNLFKDKDKVKKQKENFLAEVQRLNNQTRELKEAIRDRCGYRGREWYQRLEERNQMKRLYRKR